MSFNIRHPIYLTERKQFGIVNKLKRVEKCEVLTDVGKPQSNHFYDFKKTAHMHIDTGNLQISKCSRLKVKKEKTRHGANEDGLQ